MLPLFGSRGPAYVCEGTPEVEGEDVGGGTSKGKKRVGDKEAVVATEPPSQTIERVEGFMRWLCQVRCVRSLLSLFARPGRLVWFVRCSIFLFNQIVNRSCCDMILRDRLSQQFFASSFSKFLGVG